MPLLWGPYGSNVPAIGDYKGRKIFQAHESRTNYYTYSGDPTQTDWLKPYCSPLSDSLTPPNSNFQAYKLRATTDDQYHSIRQALSVDGTSRYCLSALVHAGEYDWVGILTGSSGMTGTPYAWFNVTKGVIGSYGDMDLCDLFPLGFGWWYLFGSATSDVATTASPAIHFAKEDPESASYSYVGDGSSGIYCCHAQFEKSPNGRPSPPIITGASAVSTNSDNMVFGPDDFDYELFKKKFGFIWVPNWSSEVPNDISYFYWLGADSSNYTRLLRVNNSIYHSHEVGGGGVVHDVIISKPTYFHQQKMLFLVDPEEGSLEIVGAQSGGAKVVDVSWTEFVLPTYELGIAAGLTTGQWPLDGSITNFFRV